MGKTSAEAVNTLATATLPVTGVPGILPPMRDLL